MTKHWHLMLAFVRGTKSWENTAQEVTLVLTCCYGTQERSQIDNAGL